MTIKSVILTNFEYMTTDQVANMDCLEEKTVFAGSSYVYTCVAMMSFVSLRGERVLRLIFSSPSEEMPTVFMDYSYETNRLLDIIV